MAMETVIINMRAGRMSSQGSHAFLKVPESPGIFFL